MSSLGAFQLPPRRQPPASASNAAAVAGDSQLVKPLLPIIDPATRPAHNKVEDATATVLRRISGLRSGRICPLSRASLSTRLEAHFHHSQRYCCCYSLLPCPRCSHAATAEIGARDVCTSPTPTDSSARRGESSQRHPRAANCLLFRSSPADHAANFPSSARPPIESLARLLGSTAWPGPARGQNVRPRCSPAS